MSLTLSSIAQTQLDQVYRALDGILEKGAAHASQTGADESVYLGWRLAPDMLPLSRQVQLVSDFSVRGMARLAGEEPPAMADDEADFQALRDRLAKARDVVQAFDADRIDDQPEAMITFPAGPDRELTLPRQSYLQNFVFANVLFHAATTYNILRSVGVPLGKADMMGVRL